MSVTIRSSGRQYRSDWTVPYMSVFTNIIQVVLVGFWRDWVQLEDRQDLDVGLEAGLPEVQLQSLWDGTMSYPVFDSCQYWIPVLCLSSFSRSGNVLQYGWQHSGW